MGFTLATPLNGASYLRLDALDVNLNPVFRKVDGAATVPSTRPIRFMVFGYASLEGRSNGEAPLWVLHHSSYTLADLGLVQVQFATLAAGPTYQPAQAFTAQALWQAVYTRLMQDYPGSVPDLQKRFAS